MVDTYTISGPPGSEGTPVDARVVFRGTGTLFVGQRAAPFTRDRARCGWRSGPGTPNTYPALSEQFRVNAFSPAFEAFQGIPNANYGASTPTLELDMTIDQILTRTVGEPFDVAFGLDAQGNGAGNLSLSPSPAEDEYLVCTIDWELPAGYQITSASGWTDPGGPTSYCTAGTSAAGCQALLSASGTPSASAASGFVVQAAGLGPNVSGAFFWGTNGPQANTWGNGTSWMCVLPPVSRGFTVASSAVAACGATLAYDLTAHWQAKPASNPGAGTVTHLQLWYRDPLNTSNQKTSLSDALELTVCP